MYGFKYVGNLFGSAQPMTRRFKMTASETITKGDAVILTSGLLDSGTTVDGAKVVGVANETKTDSGSATDTCEIIVARRGDLYIADNDNDTTTFASTHVGTYFDTVEAATALQQIDTSTTGTTGTWLCVEYNPQGFGYDSDTSIGLFTPAETIFDGRTA